MIKLKIIVIFLLLMALMTVLSISANLFIGFGFKDAIRELAKSFYAMTVAEKVLYTLFPLVIFLHPLYFRYKKGKQSQNE